jgi:hypothetical protein
MSFPGYDPVADAQFQTETKMEMRYLKQQITLLWKYYEKQQTNTTASETRLEEQIDVVETRLTGQIDAIKRRINGAVLWAGLGAAGIVIGLVRAKLGL